MSSLHPLTLFLDRAVRVFTDLGFEVVEGPEIENEWYNFDFLRVPADHPARDVQDTFWLADNRLLRTHTTALQGRIMANRRPPIRAIMPGRCFRREATDQAHETTFYQLDGLVIDQKATMAELMGTLDHFLHSIFGRKIKTRFIPHHYRFVEPGMDVHIEWGKRWLEVLGSGMVHPEVLKNMKLNPRQWQGWAFGLGIDRLMMLDYGVDDIRLSYQNDFRFLKQFGVS